MQALPDRMRFASRLATMTGLANGNCTIMSTTRLQAQQSGMLDNLGSPIGRRANIAVLIGISQNPDSLAFA